MTHSNKLSIIKRLANRTKSLFVLIVFTSLLLPPAVFFAPAQAVAPADFGLNEGDLVSAAGSDDPDVYIINEWGYKRLFLNPAIFGFYGHLKWENIRTIYPVVRDAFVTSGLFRNCEQNDPKVYGVEVTTEDGGTLHWVNVSGEQAVSEDPNFSKKVFCINTQEFNWYTKSSDYTSLSQVPQYSRTPSVELSVLPEFPIVTTWSTPNACLPIVEPEELLPDQYVSDPPRGTAQLIKNVVTETYDVFGTNANEVRVSLDQNGPINSNNNERSDALTSGNTSFTYHYQDAGISCYLVDATVTVDITITMPEWVNESSAPLQEQALWDMSQENLMTHEQGHVNLSLLAARYLQEDFSKPISAPTCQQLFDMLNNLGNDWVAVASQYYVTYDDRSDHGLSQGAAFPLYCPVGRPN